MNFFKWKNNKIVGGIICLLVFLSFPSGFSLYIALIRFFFDLAFTLSYEYTTEIYPTVMRTTGLSIASCVSRVGSITMPWITLKLMQKALFLPYIIFGIFSAVAAVLNVLIPIDTKDMDLDTFK